MYIIPLTTDANQTFRCVIPVNGKNLPLNFFLSYNTVSEYWIMRLSDDFGNILVDSLPIQTGIYPAANLLEQYQHLQIGSAVVVPVGSLPEEQQPDDTNLGSKFVLVWGDGIE